MNNNVLMIANSIDIKEVPKEIKLLPMGYVKSQKGNFIVDKNSYISMNKQFQDRKIDIVVDYEHQTLKDVQAPAGGWIKKIILKVDGIYAQVEWTKKALEYLKNKEYRYLSPVILANKSDSRAVSLHSVALTNTPAIDGMEAIINSINIKEEGVLNMESLLNQDQTKQLLTELELQETATIEDIIKAIQDLKVAQSESEVIANKLIQNESNELVQLSLSLGQINEEQKDWAIKRCIEDIDGFKIFVNSAFEKECDNLIHLALSTGKIAPFQQEWAKQLALKDIDGLKTFIDQALPVIPMGEILYLKDDKGLKDRSSANSKNSISDMLGVSYDDIKKYGNK